MKRRRIVCAVTAFLAALVLLAGCPDVENPTEKDPNNGKGPDVGGALTLSGDISTDPEGEVVVNTELTAVYSGTEAVSYQWKKGETVVGSAKEYTPAEVGAYTVTVGASGYNPKTSAPVTVVLPNLAGTLTITASEDPNKTTGFTIDDELYATYTAGADENVSFIYQWKKDSIAIGETGRYCEPTEAGTYAVTVSAVGYNPLTHTVFVTDPSYETLDGIVSISPSSGVTTYTLLTANYNGTETEVALSWQWKNQNEAIVGTDATYTPTLAGTYTVTARANNYNPKASAPVAVTLSTLAGALTISPSTAVTGTELTATYNGTEGAALSYQWHRDGAPVGTNLNKFTPTASGGYTVTISALGYNPKTSAAVTVTASSGGGGGEGKGPNASEYPNPVPQPAIDPANVWSKTEKRTAPNANGSARPRVYHEVWIGVDTNADPRNVVGYKLANSGKQFFDNVVIFHADLSWSHYDPDTRTEAVPEKRGWCTEQGINGKGIHLHFPDKVQWLLKDRQKFLKPLKDAGMQVLICPLPSQGVSYHTIGDWPGGNNTWNNNGGGGGSNLGNYETIMGDAGARQWARSLAKFCDDYDFDGIALDDEYGELPTGHGLRSSIYSLPDTASGQNIFRWLRYFKDMTTDTTPVPGYPGGRWPNGKWVSVYYHRYGGKIASSLTMASEKYDGTAIASRQYSINDVVDAIFPDQYGEFTGGNIGGVNTSKKAYFSSAFDGAGSSISVSMDSIGQATRTAMNGGYGVFMYFALQHRGHYQTLKFFDEAFGTQPDIWLSKISNVLYQDGVWYDGPDHPKFPMQRGIGTWTSGTGALYKPNPGPGEQPSDYSSDYF